MIFYSVRHLEIAQDFDIIFKINVVDFEVLWEHVTTRYNDQIWVERWNAMRHKPKRRDARSNAGLGVPTRT